MYKDLIKTIRGFEEKDRYYWMKVSQRIYNLSDEVMGFICLKSMEK